MTQEQFENLVPMTDKVRNEFIDGQVYEYVYAGKIDNYSAIGEWSLLLGTGTNSKLAIRNEHLLSYFEIIR